MLNLVQVYQRFVFLFVERVKKMFQNQAKIILDTPADIIEWRMDWFDGVEDTNEVVEMAKELREAFKETPVLATFRSKKEGGELEVSTEYYVELNCAVAKSGQQMQWMLNYILGIQKLKRL